MTIPIPTCTRRIQFCAGHRVLNHESKCHNPHGHNYVLYATAQASDLDELGRVIDFSVIKEKLGGWIDKYWDHGFIFFNEDEVISQFYGRNEDLKYFGTPFNPTAENMALFLLNVICPKLFRDMGVKIVKIKLEETENCFAEVSL